MDCLLAGFWRSKMLSRREAYWDFGASARDKRGSTINPDFCTRDMARCVRSQEHDKLSYLLGGSRLSTTERDSPLWILDRKPDLLQVPPLRVRVKFGFRRAMTHNIHSD